MFIFKGLHNPKIMRTFEPKMLADSTDIEEEITFGS